MSRIEQEGALTAAFEPRFDPPPVLACAPRHQVRAWRLWAAMRRGERWPRADDLRSQAPAAFGRDSFLVELARGDMPPRLHLVGPDLAKDAGLDPEHPRLADAPRASLFVQLIRRLHKVRDAGAPLGFEADLVDHEGRPAHHAGILLPCTDDHGEIAFVYGAIGRNEVAELDGDMLAAVAAASLVTPHEPAISSWHGGESAAPDPARALPALLATARTWAALAGTGHAGRAWSLYAALGAAHDFLLAGDADPVSFAALAAAEASVPGSAIATAIRLVFGEAVSRADRARHAAVLAHARRLGLGPGMLADMLKRVSGGAATLVAVEHRARRAARGGGAAAERRTVRPGEIVFMPIDERAFRPHAQAIAPARFGSTTPFGRIAG